MQDRSEQAIADNPLRHLTAAQFMALGGNAVVYIRPITGAKLGDNRGAAIGIGPQIGFFFPAWQGYTGYLNLRGYADIYTENRPTNTTFMATVSFSPAAPEHPPASRAPRISK